MSDVYSRSAQDIRSAVLGMTDFNIILSALRETEGVSVVSNPKIIVANEEKATIHIGQTERPFISTVTPATESSAPFTTYNPGEPVEFGVKLDVTPTVNTASNISLLIEPTLTRFVRDAVAPTGQSYPIIARKTISTRFTLEDGKTVAIGGLTETADNERVRKIPLLGDIPLIGRYLFTHTRNERRQTETIIFVTVGMATPHLIQRDQGLPGNTRLTQRHVLRQQLERHEHEQALNAYRLTVEQAIADSPPEPEADVTLEDAIDSEPKTDATQDGAYVPASESDLTPEGEPAPKTEAGVDSETLPSPEPGNEDEPLTGPADAEDEPLTAPAGAEDEPLTGPADAETDPVIAEQVRRAFGG